ncbi:MAG TPA: T9SS type A sorting domain-containing protein [Puia sp.]|nr:T9SS type A sorting domain-containing protein [Puia sp.]
MKRNRLLTRKTGIRAFAALCMLLPLLGYGAVFNVTTTTDGNATNQLRGAILAADATGGTNTINVPAGTYTLTLGTITFGNTAMSLSIIGAGSGSTIINMSTTNRDRIFLINPPGTVPGVNVAIQGLTFTNGFLSGDNFGGGAILCGGPLNTVNLKNCVFSSNSTNTGVASNGGAIAMEGGGALSIDQCSFLNNTDPNGNGGALFYFGPNTQSGSLSITNSLFTGNTATTASAEGGALFVTVQGSAGGFTSAISIQKNTFTGNKAIATNGTGGAIGINNGFSTSNTALINYNRFYGNTATKFPDVAMNSASGNADITNNWWGSNTSPVSGVNPHAGIIGTGGAGVLTSSTWLRFSCTGSTSTVCSGSGGNTTLMTAGFLTNSAGTAISAANLTALAGVPVNFTATLGTLSGAQTSIQAAGTATVNFQSNGTAGAAVVQAVADSVPTSDPVAAANITVNAPALAAISTSGSVSMGAPTPVITDASCNQICSVTPSGSQPLSGSVNARVTIDATVASFHGQPYLTRHYDIEPTAGAGTATATITLYYLQSEFSAYNAAVTGSQNMLPTGPTDNVGKGNLTITQYHGAGTAPGNYSGWAGTGPAALLITPGASNVVWNPAKLWWEVSFSVTGFSGFYATGPVGLPLPVVLERFTGASQAAGVLLTWKVGVESGLSRYEVESSTDGTGYSNIGSVAATGKGAYQFFQANPAAGNNFYRLKMVDFDGKFNYSGVVIVNSKVGTGNVIKVLSNPFASSCTIRILAEEAGPVSVRLTDISGKTLWQENKVLSGGANTFPLSRTNQLAKGIYLLTIAGRQVQETMKLVKE